ncbi:hypothetical protein RUND412_010839, partial [Rhizina undulata]
MARGLFLITICFTAAATALKVPQVGGVEHVELDVADRTNRRVGEEEHIAIILTPTTLEFNTDDLPFTTCTDTEKEPETEEWVFVCHDCDESERGSGVEAQELEARQCEGEICEREVNDGGGVEDHGSNYERRIVVHGEECSEVSDEAGGCEASCAEDPAYCLSNLSSQKLKALEQPSPTHTSFLTSFTTADTATITSDPGLANGPPIPEIARLPIDPTTSRSYGPSNFFGIATRSFDLSLVEPTAAPSPRWGQN